MRGSKRLTCVRLVQEAANLDVVTGAHANHLLLLLGRVVDVEYLVDGLSVRQHAAQVVLEIGAIGSPTAA